MHTPTRKFDTSETYSLLPSQVECTNQQRGQLCLTTRTKPSWPGERNESGTNEARTRIPEVTKRNGVANLPEVTLEIITFNSKTFALAVFALGTTSKYNSIVFCFRKRGVQRGS